MFLILASFKNFNTVACTQEKKQSFGMTFAWAQNNILCVNFCASKASKTNPKMPSRNQRIITVALLISSIAASMLFGEGIAALEGICLFRLLKNFSIKTGSWYLYLDYSFMLNSRIDNCRNTGIENLIMIFILSGFPFFPT